MPFRSRRIVDPIWYQGYGQAVSSGTMETLEHRTFRQKYPSIIPAALVGACFLLPVLPMLALLPQAAIISSGGECDRRFWPCLIAFTVLAVAPWIVSGTMERDKDRKRSVLLLMSFWTAAWLQFPALALLLGQRASCHGDGQSILAVIVSGPTTSVLTVVIAVIHDWVRLRYIRMSIR